MDFIFVFEQVLNGLGYGLMLFLIAAGLTLVFGIMDTMNLAHGSLYMAGAYIAARVHESSGSFAGAVLLACAVVKLFAVDLSGQGTVARIVSFLGVGGLMVAIGYFSPLPPGTVAEEGKA